MTGNPKELLGYLVASQITPGSTIAVGTGSTVDAVVRALGQRIAEEKFSLTVVPTSLETALLCASVGCTVLSPYAIPTEISWGFDGADEVDERLRLIKGLGGALLREKIVASHCRSFTILVDESKLVSQLGQRCAIPVEVIPEALSLVTRELRALGATEVTLRDGRSGKHGPAVTESGHIILDARFLEINDELPRLIKGIVGVVEHGVFIDRCDQVIIASPNGGMSERRTPRSEGRIRL